MSKLILTSLCTAAALGLAACGGGEENMAVENVEELNATEDLNMDMNMDVNMDMNAVDNATDNATADEATETNSY